MTTNVERPRYFERQYLRSFDLEAEQSYHLQMRRRLNRALHRWGIVEGLELLHWDGSTEPAGFYVSPGMAIDAYGREILVARPRRLESQDLLDNRVQRAGTYGIWIAYDRFADTPPEAGFEDCHIEDQYTRWRETFRVLITEDPPPPFDLSGDAPLPELEGRLPDDPEAAAWPVRLGDLTIDNVGGLKIIGAESARRRYIGSTSQRIHAPAFEPDPASPATFDPLSGARPLDPPLSVAIEDNAQARQNLVVGENFEVDQTEIQPPPGASFPDPTGNLKVAGDLFLGGDAYRRVGAEWLRLDELVKRHVPEIKTGTTTIITGAGGDPSTGTEVVSVATSLPTVTSADLVVSVAGIEMLPLNPLVGDWLAGIDGDAPIVWSVRVTGPPSVSGSNHEFTVGWEVGPEGDDKLHVKSITVSWMAVFQP